MSLNEQVREHALTTVENVPKVFLAGKAKGHEQGVADGISQGIEQGRQAGYDAMWDMLQANGARTTYSWFFGNANIVGEIRPKYEIKPSTSLGQMCINNYNLTKFYNWGFPTSGVTSCLSAFANCNNFLGFVDENGEVIKGKSFFGNGVTDYRYCFQNNYKIEYICIDVTSHAQLYSGVFQNCHELKELKIIGEIKDGGLDLHWSTKLSKASLDGILGALSSTTNGLVVTLSQTAVDNAYAVYDEEGNLVFPGSASPEFQGWANVHPNWTITLK